MNNFPTETTCGECRKRVALNKHRWDEFETDFGIVAGFTQQAHCHRCDSTVVCFVGNGALLLATNNQVQRPKH